MQDGKELRLAAAHSGKPGSLQISVTEDHDMDSDVTENNFEVVYNETVRCSRGSAMFALWYQLPSSLTGTGSIKEPFTGAQFLTVPADFNIKP